MIALAITYALSLTGLLNGLLGSFIETEKEMISVERIDDYLTNVPAEEDYGKTTA
ncbi:Multidrug resistance-associated protein 7, partial [Parelaphostrongylus tenuis]